MARKIIDAGELNEKIDIKRLYYRRDDTGSEVLRSTPVLKNLWAKVEDLSGLEDEENGRVVSVSVTLFSVRYYPELLQDWKNLVVCYNDDEYNVIHVKRIGRKQFLQLKTVMRD